MSPQEKELDRIQKLLAKANDAATTTAEAAAFAAKAAELATRANLNLSDIDWTDLKEKSPIGRFHFYPADYELKVSKTRVSWMEQVCSAVCRSQNVKIILMGGNSYELVGRGGNIEVAAYLCAFLCRFGLNMSQRDYGIEWKRAAKAGDVTQARGFKASWLNGFSREVVRRLLDMRQTLELEYAQTTALVRMKSEYDEANSWADENMNLRKSTSLAGRSSSHGRGHRAGQRAGANVDVSGRATGAGSDVRMLS